MIGRAPWGAVWLARAAIVVAVVQPVAGHAQVAVTGEVRESAAGPVSSAVYLVPDDGVIRPEDRSEAVIDQFGLQYRPTVRLVLPGTTIDFRNSDALLHNVFSPAGPGAGFDLGTYPFQESRSHTFDEIGTVAGTRINRVDGRRKILEHLQAFNFLYAENVGRAHAVHDVTGELGQAPLVFLG